MSDKLKLKVFDEDYTLRINSSVGEERIERVADFVDRKMKETASHYVNLNAKHVAVLTALNIAEEYLRIRNVENVENVDNVENAENVEKEGPEGAARSGEQSGGEQPQGDPETEREINRIYKKVKHVLTRDERARG